MTCNDGIFERELARNLTTGGFLPVSTAINQLSNLCSSSLVCKQKFEKVFQRETKQTISILTLSCCHCCCCEVLKP